MFTCGSPLGTVPLRPTGAQWPAKGQRHDLGCGDAGSRAQRSQGLARGSCASAPTPVPVSSLHLPTELMEAPRHGARSRWKGGIRERPANNPNCPTCRQLVTAVHAGRSPPAGKHLQRSRSLPVTTRLGTDRAGTRSRVSPTQQPVLWVPSALRTAKLLVRVKGGTGDENWVQMAPQNRSSAQSLHLGPFLPVIYDLEARGWGEQHSCVCFVL